MRLLHCSIHGLVDTLGLTKAESVTMERPAFVDWNILAAHARFGGMKAFLHIHHSFFFLLQFEKITSLRFCSIIT